MRIFLLNLAIVATVVVAQYSPPQKLLCNRLYGNYVFDSIVEFGRPLEPGDKITINGTCNPSYHMNWINIFDSTISKSLFHARTALSTDWPPRWGEMLYNTNVGGGWGGNEFGPKPFVNGQPIQLSIVYTGAAYMVYSGDVLIKNYALRYSPSVAVPMKLNMGGGWTTNWIEIQCARPLPTTAAPTTKRHRHRHRDRHRHSSSDSSDSGEEYC